MIQDDEIRAAIEQHFAREFERFKGSLVQSSVLNYDHDADDLADDLLEGAYIEIHWSQVPLTD